MQLKDISAVAYASDAEITNRYKSAFIEAAYPGAFRPSLYSQAEIEKTLREQQVKLGRL